MSNCIFNILDIRFNLNLIFYIPFCYSPNNINIFKPRFNLMKKVENF